MRSLIVRVVEFSFCRLTAALLLFGVAVLSASGQVMTVVVPNHLTSVEGNSGRDVPPDAGYRHQILQLASEFLLLPETHRTVLGVYLRPDASLTEGRTVEYDHLNVSYSTTTRGPGELDTSFANNVGSDVVTVFDGPVSVTTQATGPPAGPRGFDYFYPYTMPFQYDPTGGRNLLWDLTNFNGVSAVFSIDAYTPSDTILLHAAPDASTGQLFRVGFIVQFLVGPAFPGDYNDDGFVGDADYNVWQGQFGTTGLEAYAPGDGDGDGSVTGQDFLVWQRRFGTVVPKLGYSASAGAIPEPATSTMLLVGCMTWIGLRRLI